MRFSALFVGLATLIATVLADCGHSSAPPDNGDIALYEKENCSGSYRNVGAMDFCENMVDFDACSAITRAGVTCDIYKTDGCDEDYIATIDSAGYRAFCGVFIDNVQSVRCRNA
ncbi:hypothetical protein BG015_000712 [Linnemannia schmuckeri]|uniref:Uncharacterized protein n=1 Tax=Linnemannia schmuckeri TaxID=64567 RepID=A0A9P5RTF0_9FUNG|nr:hypothetical protein BG015_000712 [Linnemannia schmuckeri]